MSIAKNYVDLVTNHSDFFDRTTFRLVTVCGLFEITAYVNVVHNQATNHVAVVHEYSLVVDHNVDHLHAPNDGNVIDRTSTIVVRSVVNNHDRDLKDDNDVVVNSNNHHTTNHDNFFS